MAIKNKLTDEEKKIIEENNIINSRKAKMFIKIIDSLPENSIWGLQEFSDEMWLHFGDWNKIKPFLIECDKTFEYIYPDIYFQINHCSKEILKDILLKNPDSISGSYFWHNVFFKGEIVYAEVYEGNLSAFVRKDLGIDISGNENWVGYY